ncbi:MAG: class I mannose-6-phosphate isomerase [Muribaculaceae bacterium]|nr:class I mannose-6-phosphate isomerase [Muribaculaceae bacterium]
MEIKNQPLSFLPYLKSVIWGGEKIKVYKGINTDQEKIGESWEISAVPGHVSVVEEGLYKGMSLNDLIDEFGSQLLGESVTKKYGKNFPLLIKFIDAADNLSVQVHPDDQLARKRHNSLGKTEMWYIIDAEPDAKIFSGLNREITPEEYKKRVEEGTFAETLAEHSSNPGDVFFLPAGRIHAIGAGNLLAEIQENSDVTYRIYDYDRRDANGNPRELHTDLAKDAIDYKVYDNYKEEAPSESEKEVTLAECEHFVTKRLIIDGNKTIVTDGHSFEILICLEGNVKIICSEGSTHLNAGHSALIPAKVKQFTLEGKAKLLSTHL